MQIKFDKYWGNCNLLLSMAATLDPRFKMRLIDFAYKSIYFEYEAVEQKTILRESLQDLFSEYLEAHKADNSNGSTETLVEASAYVSSTATTSKVSGTKLATGRSKYRESLAKDTTLDVSLKSELETYLEEGVLKLDPKDDAEFDVICWWKSNSLNFRVLSKMAVEILSIPITTVASESTFSAGGRVIDQYRSSLGTEVVQVLLCGNDWFRGVHGLKKKLRVSSLLLLPLFLCFQNF